MSNRLYEKLLALNLTCLLGAAWPYAARAEMEDYLTVNSPAYIDTTEMSLRPARDGQPARMSVPFPEDAQRYADGFKRSLVTPKTGEISDKIDSCVHTLSDSHGKVLIVITPRRTTHRKDNTQELIVLTQQFPRDSNAFHQLQMIYERKKMWPLVIDNYLKACTVKKLTADEEIIGNDQSAQSRSQIASNVAYFECQMGRYSSAIKELSKAIELQPEYFANYKNRAIAYRKLNQEALAKADEDKIVELRKNKTLKDSTLTSSDLTNSNSSLYSQKGIFDQALAMSELVLKKDPNNKEAMLEKARTLKLMGHFEQSLAIYKHLKSMVKTNTPRFDQEMAAVQNVVKNGAPPYGDLKLFQGSANRKFQSLQDGKIVFRSLSDIAKASKGDWRVYKAIAVQEKQKEDLVAYDAELSKMQSICPLDFEVLSSRVETTSALRKWADAKKLCSQYLEMRKDGYSTQANVDFIQYVYNVKANAERALKQYDEAIADEGVLLKFEPDSAEFYRDRADCYMAMGKFQAAIDDYGKSIQNDDTKTANNYLRRAAAFDKLHKSAEAAADRKQASLLSQSAKS